MPPRSPSRRGSRHTTAAPKCVFRRLMIVHYQLPELCIDGGLDEGASLEELSENILYYHHNVSVVSAAGNEAEQHESHATSDAVQFAGLCSALLSLSDAVTGNETSVDETREVHLAGSTLVFVPLEHCGIIAIAQVERSSPTSFKDYHVHGNNGSPLAVRKSIEKCHELFCLLRGGIHFHLSRHSTTGVINAEETSAASIMQSSIMNILQAKEDNDRSVYPGMSELYSMRKQVRRMRRDLSRCTNAEQQEELTVSIAQLDERIEKLAETLPIATLRKQLRTHYDEYIADTGLVLTTTGVLHTCLVENVPAPIVKPTETFSPEYPPLLPRATAIDTLKQAAQNVLDKAAADCDAAEPLLVGMSLFFNSDFISSHSSASANVPAVSPQTACLLMEFMASYRSKIFVHAQQHSGQQSIQARSPPRKIGSGLRRLLSASLIDDDTIVTADPGDTAINDLEDESACFLAPPPLSMLNVSDQVLQVDLPSHGNVWTPRVYLPLETPVGCSTLEANLVLLDVGEYSFLLYLRPGEAAVNHEEIASYASNEDSTEQGTTMASSAVIIIPAYSRLLGMVAIDLANAVSTACDLEEDAVDEGRENPFTGSGVHVVFIDRVSQRVVLYSDDNDGSRQRTGSSKAGCAKLRGKPTRTDQTPVDVSSGVDCRHILASNLPSNAVAAFDDLMNQVHERISSSNEGILQLCTYMPEGWVYAHAHDDKEIYIFFNASQFVTVSDVQHAADRMRTELFNDSIR